METGNYLSIIRKSDFVDLFKYGWLYIAQAVPFDGNINDHKDDELFKTLTCKMNLFEYSFEYLIIHFIGEDSNLVHIGNVLGIYALDEEAKREITNSFDPRIQIHVSPWADKIQALRQKFFKVQALRGVENLWQIFDLSEEDKNKCNEIITDEILDEVFREIFSNTRPIGEQSLWVYLLRYERHSFYPKDMRGFFCDCIHTVCNWMKGREIIEDVAETTAVYKSLMDCKQDFASLSKVMNDSPLAAKTKESVLCRYVVAAPLFLFLKDKFSDGVIEVDIKDIAYAKKIGGFECTLAVFLLGLTLGYDKTYDAYYDCISLPIFKKKENISFNVDVNANVVDKNSPIERNADSAVKISEEKSEGWLQRPLLATMYKGRKGSKNYDCRQVYSLDEFEKLQALGYKAYKQTTKRRK